MKNKTFFKINLIYYIAMIAVAVVFFLGYSGIVTSDWLSSFLIQIVVMFGVPMLLYSLLVSKSAKKTFSDFGVKKISGSIVLISFILGIVLYVINSFVANVFSSIISVLGYENLYSGTTVTLTYGYVFKEFLLSAILPGLCEEFLHRGMMLFAGKKCGNTRFVLIISSLLFGLMHLNINQFFYAAILGFLMGYVALCADSIIPSMIIHFMNNFLSSYLYYGYYLNWPFATMVNAIETFIYSNPVIFVLFTVVFVGMMIFLYIYLTRRIRLIKLKEQQNKVFSQSTTSAGISALTINTDKASTGEPSSQDFDVDDLISILNKNEQLETNTDRHTPESNILTENHVEIVPATDVYKDDTSPKESNANEEINDLSIFKSIPTGKKFSFFEKSFLISSIILGTIITISSFVWGVM